MDNPLPAKKGKGAKDKKGKEEKDKAAKEEKETKVPLALGGGDRH